MRTLHSLLFVLPFISEQRKTLDEKIYFIPHSSKIIKYHKPDKWQWLEMTWGKKNTLKQYALSRMRFIFGYCEQFYGELDLG